MYRKKEERKRERKEGRRKIDTSRVENAVSHVNIVLVLVLYVRK